MQQNRPIVIYTSGLTNRKKYTLYFIFNSFLQVNYTLTDDINSIDKDSFVISYNNISDNKNHFIKAVNLLDENIVLNPVLPTVTWINEKPYLFAFDEPNNALLPYDIFSAVFFCLSIYPAYLNPAKDQHDRIDANEWFFRKNKLDQYPYVELWLSELKSALEKHGFSFQNTQKFQRHISFDIDHCFAYSSRTFLGHAKGIAKDVVKFDFNNLSQRLAVLANKQPDPYSKFLELLPQIKSDELKVFFLMKAGKNNSLNILSEEKIAFIKETGKFAKVGLHPSYFSGLNKTDIQGEMSSLQKVFPSAVQSSRQHYLRTFYPETIRYLNNIGITDEYSLGYYDQPGLKVATALSFPFYDLLEEKELPIIMHPFYWMDSMNRYYRTISEQNELEEINEWEIKFQANNTTARYVFHNDSLFLKRYELLLMFLSDC